MTNQTAPFAPIELPYAETDLKPHISEVTFHYHYGRHYTGYVNNLNKLVAGTDLEQKSLEDIVKTAEGGVFNNAAQAWNHAFYFKSLSPQGGGEPSGEVAGLINETFGSFDAFKKAFGEAGMGVFGSGWVWLTWNANDGLKIVKTSNADTPIRDGKDVPLLTCDVWEHAYYIDYHNARDRYLQAWWSLVNWKFAEQNLA